MIVEFQELMNAIQEYRQHKAENNPDISREYGYLRARIERTWRGEHQPDADDDPHWSDGGKKMNKNATLSNSPVVAVLPTRSHLECQPVVHNPARDVSVPDMPVEAEGHAAHGLRDELGKWISACDCAGCGGAGHRDGRGNVTN